MCRATTQPERVNNICIYFGSKSHSAGKCTNRPNDNREEPRSMPRDLQDHRFRNTGNQNCFFEQNKVGHQQARFDKRLNRQYSPNYNNYQPSPLGSIPGQDLSTTVIDLANIQSRSLEIMVANQRSQQEAFSELTKARTKQMMLCLLQSKHVMEQIDASLSIGLTRSTMHAE